MDSTKKSGIKTSEFWLTAISSLLTIVNQAGFLGSPIPVEAVMTLAGMVLPYVFGRSLVKARKSL